MNICINIDVEAFWLSHLLDSRCLVGEQTYSKALILGAQYTAFNQKVRSWIFCPNGFFILGFHTG